MARATAGRQVRAPGRHTPQAAINPVAWLLWFLAVASMPLTSRNPLYLTLTLLVVAVVYLTRPRRGAAARAWRLFAIVGATLALLSIGFNLLTVHVGDRTLAELPGWLPIIGGRLTWNGLVYGVLSALAIGTLLLVATTFNTAVRHADLLRLLPGRIAGLGVAGSVALTMIPQTIAAGRDILDAQRARGHRFRRLRDGREFVVPLLAVGLERALTLSEALETRGFGAGVIETPIRARLPRHLLLASVALTLLSATLALATGRLVLGSGALLLTGVLAVWATPPRAPRTRFRRMEWNTPSLVVAGAAALAIVGLVLAVTAFDVALAYDPFPRLERPTFAPLVGGAILLLLAPVFWSES